MKLTRGEFCQFNLNTRLQLVKEFGRNVLEKKCAMRRVSVYRIYCFYVEVFENLASHSSHSSHRLEKVELLKNSDILEVYNSL